MHAETSDTPRLRSPLQRLGDVARVVRRRWMVALAVLVAVGAVAGAYLATAERIYESRAQFLLQPTDAVATVVNPDSTPSAANALRDVDTNAGLVTVRPVARRVIAELGLDESPQALLDRVSISGQDRSNLVWITARDPSARQAARIATEFARQAAVYRQETVRAQVESAIAAGRRTIDETVDPGARAALERRLRALEAERAVQSVGMQLVERASVPGAPASPRVALVVGAAVVLGGLLAILAALLAERLDPRLRAPDDVAAAFELPVLETISPRGGAPADLAARLVADGAVDGRRALLFADASDAVLAADLAEHVCARLAATGRRALLVETAARHGDESLGGGLATAVERHVAVRDLAVPARLVGDGEGTATYDVLALGAPPSGATAVLSHRELDAVLVEARAMADVVVVAGAGVRPPRSFLPLLRTCDAVLLVVEGGHVTRTHANRARAALGDQARKALGVVVVERAPGGAVRVDASAALTDLAPPLAPAAR